MLTLARKIVSGDQDDAETVEWVFARVRESEAASEEYLVDDGWEAVEPEPIVSDMSRNGAASEDLVPVVTDLDDEA